MPATELLLRLGAWALASAFVLAASYLVHRQLRSSRSALNVVGFLGLSIFTITLMLMIMGLAGLLTATAVALASGVGLGVLLGLPATRRDLKRAQVDLLSFSESLSLLWADLPRWLRWLTAAFVAISVLRFAFLIWALPPFVWDSLTYHLTNVAHWVQAGRIELFDTPMVRIYTPANYELLAAWFAVFLHHDVVIEAAGIPGYLLAVAAVYASARTLDASREASWLAALAYAATPALLIATTGTKNDPHMAGYYLALLAFGLDIARRGRRDRSGGLLGSLVMSALFLFLAVGTKAYIAHILPGLLLIMLAAGWQEGGIGWIAARLRAAKSEWRRTTGNRRALLLLILVAGLFVGGYWNSRNWLLTGNPFYPYGVQVEGERMAQGPHNDILLDLERAQANFASLAHKFGDHQAPIRPDLVDVTGWGWFVYVLGIPVSLWALLRERRSWPLAAGFSLSLALIFFSIRPSPWNLRYILWFPAVFALMFAFWWDRLPTRSALLRWGFGLLFASAIGLNLAATLNYNRVSPEEFDTVVATSVWQRGSARSGLTVPRHYANALQMAPADQVLGYNVHGNGFIYPLFRPDFSQQLAYVPMSPTTDCREVADRMQDAGTRYLFMAPEHTDDQVIARANECGEMGDHILERVEGFYVIP